MRGWWFGALVLLAFGGHVPSTAAGSGVAMSSSCVRGAVAGGAWGSGGIGGCDGLIVDNVNPMLRLRGGKRGGPGGKFKFRGTNQRYKKKAMRERASAKPSIRTKGQITKVMRTALRKGGKLELDTGKSDAEIEREDKAIVLSDDVVEEMKRMLYNWQVYNTREDVAQLDENDRGGPPVEIVEVDEDRQVIKKEAPSGARKTWEDFRDEAMSALKQSNATVADDLETFMKMDDEDQSIALRVNHPDLLDWMQKSMLMDMDRTAEAEAREIVADVEAQEAKAQAARDAAEEEEKDAEKEKEEKEKEEEEGDAVVTEKKGEEVMEEAEE